MISSIARQSGRTPLDSARRIHAHLPAARRRQLVGTIALMVAGAFAELATIGAVLPFLAVVTGARSGRYGGAVAWMTSMADATGLKLMAFSAGLLVLIAVVSGGIRLLLIRNSQNLVFAVAHDLSTRIYARTLHQPYSFHVMRNTSHTIAGIEKVQYVLGNVLMPAMAGATAAVVAFFIMIGLLLVDPGTSIIACLCFVGLYAIVSLFTRRRLHRNGDIISVNMQARVQTLQEGLGGIRDVLLDRSQTVFTEKFARIDGQLRRAQATNQFIAAAPRYVVESGAVVLVAVLSLYLSGRPGGLVAALPMLGALALGAQRLLPLVQQVYFSWSQIHGNRGALENVAEMLDIPAPVPAATDPVSPLTTAVEVIDVGYSYPSGDGPALSMISLTIVKGARVGLIGKSGSGKSTLVDLLMGLLDPTEGTIRVDGRNLDVAAKPSWQAQIAHVPQAIFLSDGSVASNIAFGRDEATIDMARVEAAARGADLYEYVASLPKGFDTMVGERGIRLSGGQRQRIGIARALYKQATILVFDEATSALDDETEESVMKAIAGLSRDLTLISIAHRLTTLRGCDIVFRIDGGRIVDSGPYERVVGRRGS